MDSERSSNMKRSEASRQLNTRFADEVDSLTLHGLSRIVAANTRSRRFVWTVVFLCSFGFLIICLAKTVAKHAQKEVYIKEYKTQNKSLALPAITFCNTNMFEYHRKITPEFQYLPENCSLLDDLYFRNEINKKYFIMACRLFMGNHSQAVVKMPYYQSESLRFPRQFSFLPNIWPCFTLNRHYKLSQFSAGERSGLQMVLYFDENIFEGEKYDKKPLEDERHGLFVDFHDPKEHIHAFNGIILSPGYHTHIKLRKHVKIRKESPFQSDCVKDGKEKYKKIIPGKHIVDNCLISCINRALYKTCFYIPAIWRVFMPASEYPFTNYSESRNDTCLREVKTNFRPKDCYCNLPCYEEIYATVTSRNPWPQDWQAEMFSPIIAEVTGDRNKSYSIDDIRRKLIKLSVYYEEISQEVHEEIELYSLMDVVSDMGGQMGLLLGASCISLLEVVILLFELVARWFTGKSRKDVTIAEADF